jgi:hypothetical protein
MAICDRRQENSTTRRARHGRHQQQQGGAAFTLATHAPCCAYRKLFCLQAVTLRNGQETATQWVQVPAPYCCCSQTLGQKVTRTCVSRANLSRTGLVVSSPAAATRLRMSRSNCSPPSWLNTCEGTGDTQRVRACTCVAAQFSGKASSASARKRGTGLKETQVPHTHWRCSRHPPT